MDGGTKDLETLLIDARSAIQLIADRLPHEYGCQGDGSCNCWKLEISRLLSGVVSHA